MRTVVITRPDDWHVHFRDHDALANTVLATAQHFARALVMPNLVPPLTSISAVIDYRNRILQVLPPEITFTPYMTLYLNEDVALGALSEVKQHSYILGAKYYPKGATTNAEAGASSIESLYPWFEVMQDYSLVLQIHGEVTHGDIFERESLFIEKVLTPLIRNFPRLRIVLEHISTKAAVDFIKAANDNLAATLTPHHMLYHRNQLLSGGIHPHYYCLPILKHKNDQQAILEAALSQNPKFFAGTDSAPHEQTLKESACGCAGIYSAPYALALYAQAFGDHGKLDKLNDFVARFGADFYGLPHNRGTITILEKKQTIPASLPFGLAQVVPVAANTELSWSIDERV